MEGSLWRLGSLCFLLLIVSPSSWGHQLPVGVGAVFIQDRFVRLELTLPLSAFPEVRPAEQVSAESFTREQTVYESRIVKKMLVSTPVGGSERVFPRWVQTQLVLAPLDSSNSSRSLNLQLTALLEFPFSVEMLSIENHAWEPGLKSQTLRLDIVRRQEGLSEDVDVVLLSPTRRQAEAFVPWNLKLSRSVTLGLEHILFGLDHVVFLLTLLISGVNLRRWLILLTAFSISHALTFTLATLGWVVISPDIVEASIAASILVLALWELRQKKASLGVKSLVILGIGLIHGLGFASAMSPDTLFVNDLLSSPMLTILGFNLGIELGQIFIALTLFLAFKLVPQSQIERYGSKSRDWVLWSFASLGLIWFIQRVI